VRAGGEDRPRVVGGLQQAGNQDVLEQPQRPGPGLVRAERPERRRVGQVPQAGLQPGERAPVRAEDFIEPFGQITGGDPAAGLDHPDQRGAVVHLGRELVAGQPSVLAGRWTGPRAAQGRPAGTVRVRLVVIPDSYTLVPLDQPTAFARALSVFLSATVPPTAGVR